MTDPGKLFVEEIKMAPHIRFSIRPSSFVKNRVDFLSELEDIINQSFVRLRGWDFPHVDKKNESLMHGDSFYGSWNNSFGIKEYWKLFTSLNFIHLYQKREALEGSQWYSRFGISDPLQRFAGTDPGGRPAGFVDFVNTIWEISERFEFAAKLASISHDVPSWEVKLEFNRLNRFVVLSEPSRPLRGRFETTSDSIVFEKTYDSELLITKPKDLSSLCAKYLMERFGLTVIMIDTYRAIVDQLYSIK